MTSPEASPLLPIRTFGPIDGRPVILLHGFLADSRQWLPLIQATQNLLTQPVRWLLPDLPGHGQAATLFPPHDGWPALARLLHQSLQPHVRQSALLGGYSMGGRVAAVLAASGLLDVAGLWLESAHPPLSDAAARARREEDESRATHLLGHGMPAFVDLWQDLPLFASQRQLPRGVRDAQRRLRLSQDAVGLAQNLRWYGTGTMPADLLIGVPTRLLAGAGDAKLLDRLPAWSQFARDFQVCVATEAGHAVHLEQLTQTAAHLAAMINETFSQR